MRLFITWLTKPVRWFTAAGLWLQRVSVGCRPYGLEFVPLLLCFPAFYASDFFFKLAYAVGQFELRRLGRKRCLLGGEDYSVDFRDLPLKQRSIAKTYCALRDFSERIERSREGRY